MHLNIEILAMAVGISCLIQVAVLLSLGNLNHSMKGLYCWTFGVGLTSLASIIVVIFNQENTMGGEVFNRPAVLAIQFVLLLGLGSISLGLQRFLEKPVKVWTYFGVITTTVILSGVALFLYDNSIISAILYSTVMSVWSFVNIRFLLKVREGNTKIPIGILLTGFWVFALAYLFRALCFMSGVVTDITNYGWQNLSIYLGVLLATTLWAYGVILLINQKLINTIAVEHKNIKRLFQTNPDAVMISRFPEGQIVQVNDGVVKLTGYTEEELLSMCYKELSAWNSEEEREEAYNRLLSGKPIENQEITIRRKDGNSITGVFSADLIEMENAWHIISYTKDITDRKQLERALQTENHEKEKLIQKLRFAECSLRRLSITDELTGIYNRRHIDTRIDDEIEKSGQTQRPLSIAIFDLDHFKKVNDTWGHQVGDSILVKVADAIQQNIRNTDIFARWGGEEFTILMPDTTLEQAAIVTEKLRKIIEELQAVGVDRISCSFGVAEFDESEGLEDFFRRADFALYRAKEEGRNRVSLAPKPVKSAYAHIQIGWNPEWECGNATIDNQHKKIIFLATELLDSVIANEGLDTQRKKLQIVLCLLKEHFQDEEDILEGLDYEKAQLHRLEHERLLESTHRLMEWKEGEGFPHGLVFSFVVDEVVMGHMVHMDMEFFDFIKKRGVHDELLNESC